MYCPKFVSGTHSTFLIGKIDNAYLLEPCTRTNSRVGQDLFFAGCRISGRIIRHALPDIWFLSSRLPDIQPDNPALPDVRPHPTPESINIDRAVFLAYGMSYKISFNSADKSRCRSKLEEGNCQNKC